MLTLEFHNEDEEPIILKHLTWLPEDYHGKFVMVGFYYEDNSEAGDWTLFAIEDGFMPSLKRYIEIVKTISDRDAAAFYARLTPEEREEIPVPEVIRPTRHRMFFGETND